MEQKTYEELSRPLRPGSWEARYWSALGRLLRAISPLSDGMRIGYRYGFDSGEMLDYVYRNQARGRWGVGRLLDRAHLNAIGWRGIRQRKIHLQRVVREAILAQRVRHAPVHVADLASGPGRYLLELLQEQGQLDLRVTCRDWDETGLAQGRALASSLGLTQARYERADAFDPDHLARLAPTPHIIIVSGLYELFPDNARISRSLAGLAARLKSGGMFVYTNQPFHPQLELIARCLPNREGKPWAMRTRSQDEMDSLVRDAGLHPRQRLIDRWGIFTVSLAVKP